MFAYSRRRFQAAEFYDAAKDAFADTPPFTLLRAAC